MGKAHIVMFTMLDVSFFLERVVMRRFLFPLAVFSLSFGMAFWRPVAEEAAPTPVSSEVANTLVGSAIGAWCFIGPSSEFMSFCGPEGVCDTVAMNIGPGNSIQLITNVVACGTTAGCQTIQS